MKRRATFFAFFVLSFISIPAHAQRAVVNLAFDLDGVATCSRPIAINNFPVRGSGSGALNDDGSASLNFSLNGDAPIRFDAKLGGGARPAPFGTSRLNVVNRNQLRAVWSLPNNDIVLNFRARPGSCQATAVSQLRRGAREHNVVSGGQLAYCGQLRVTRISCVGT